MTRLQTGRNDRGANLVEFAILMPLLLLLVLGMVEFGFLFAEFNEVRHGVHEGARLAAVDDAMLFNNTCDTMDLADQVEVGFVDPGSAGQIGTVTVTATISSLSGLGFIEVFLPPTITESADFKLEQDSSGWGMPLTPCP